MNRILVVTDDVLSSSIAGPAIRAWEICSALAGDGHEVVLATTSPVCERSSDAFRTEAPTAQRWAALESWSTMVLVQGWVLERVPALRGTDKVMIVDLYDPVFLEHLELHRGRPEPERSAILADSVRVFLDQAARGDFFLCASEKQRDLWLGFLAAAGRINPATYRLDPTMRALIDVVAFGLPGSPPLHSGRPALRGAVPGIGPDDEILLWGGGVYDWLDPVTAIRAVGLLAPRRPTLRLFFLGVRHPHPDAVESDALVAARRAAAELSLTGRHVFFNETWVPYERRADYLLEADLGISLHPDHVETAYSFRTRLLDSLWAGLPSVATRGDTFGALIGREGLGEVVPPGDAAAVAAAVDRLLSDGALRASCAERARGLAGSYAWPVVLEPLLRFCAEGGRAPDRVPPPSGGPGVAARVGVASRAVDAWRRGGVRGVAGGVVRVALRRVGRRAGR